MHKRVEACLFPIRLQRRKPVEGIAGIASPLGIPSLGEHIIVPSLQPVGQAGLVKKLQLPGVGHHVVLPRTALELGGEKGFVPLHGLRDIIDDAVVVHIAVGDEFGDMVNPEDNLAFIAEKIFIHGDIHRELVPVAVNPSRQVMVEGNGYTAVTGHFRQHPQIIAVIRPPEKMPFIVPAAVFLRRERQPAVRRKFHIFKITIIRPPKPVDRPHISKFPHQIIPQSPFHPVPIVRLVSQPGEYADLVAYLHHDNRAAGRYFPSGDKRHDLVIPARYFFEEYRVEQADPVARDNVTFPVSHLHLAAVLFHEPVGKPGAAPLGQDEGPRFHDTGQAVRLATLQPAFQVFLGMGLSREIEFPFDLFMPGPGDISTDSIQTRFLCRGEVFVP